MQATAGLVVGLVLGLTLGSVAMWLWSARRRRDVTDLVTPLGSSLERIEARLRDVDSTRRDEYVILGEQVRLLRETHELLRGETASLSRSMRSPTARGRWGELQLRRVVEMAGMVRHCDFVEQENVTSEDGRTLRPDLVVRLPGGKHVAVDAKVPLDAYMDATAADDEADRTRLLGEHARRLRSHVDALASRQYWRHVADGPEFVVAFLPGDHLLAGALEADPGLLDHAVASSVLLATPTTLIALLRSVAYGWRQDALADNARAVRDAGRQLYDRLSVLADHLGAVGRNLDRAVDSYNRVVGSWESRVAVSARRLAELGVSDDDLPTPEPVTTVSRAPAACDE
ncbi:MAG TPA: DNA recombination protein RmuC [Acidimicrobiales bacterium]|nr:DNA recombination protein RmuC [Acidimicrobiales bacterium]